MSLLTRWVRSKTALEVRADRCLLIGTTRSVRQLCTMLRLERRPLRLIGCVPLRRGSRRPGTRVLGQLDQLDRIIRTHHIQCVYLSIPMAMSKLAARLVSQLNALNVTVRRVPTLRDQFEGRLGQPAGAIDTNHLLHRLDAPLDERAIAATLNDQCVLITGAGGSIGSEMACIVARYNPARLVLMERSENNLFEIDRLIAAEFPHIHRQTVLHDVTDAKRTDQIVAHARPHVILHAAAHKHVPMMEDHPAQAVQNNLFGTRAIMDAADRHDVARFVMISTDKAVHPTSVMGATKRIAERYVQHMARSSRTVGCIVRFGNVLGSACSVLPIWSQQLAAGGPITVTDPRMTRYFMTIREAASLVIQAAALDQAGGDIFVLDMGRPVRIVDLARRFVALHGLEVGRDVDMVFTGARPGEKLYEQLAYADEDMLPSAHPSVRRLRTTPPSPRYIDWLIETFGRLHHAEQPAAVLDALHQAVPEMHPTVESTAPATDVASRIEDTVENAAPLMARIQTA